MVNASWYPDPSGKFAQRYWDGTNWTEHVVGSQGQTTDPVPTGTPEQHSAAALVEEPVAPIRCDPTELHAALVEMGVEPKPAGDGSPFGEPALVMAHSEHSDGGLEWWSPTGQLVAFARVTGRGPDENPGEVPQDPATGLMLGTVMQVYAADGTPIARTTRTLRPVKPPTFVEVPSGQRIATLQQEKVLARKYDLVIEGQHGEQLGMVEATNMRSQTLEFKDAAGQRFATVHKLLGWAAQHRQVIYKSDLIVTPSEWLAHLATEAILRPRRERVVSAVVLDRPLVQPQAMLAMLGPLLVEHVIGFH